MSKGYDNRFMVCPPTFNDENECPNLAEAKQSHVGLKNHGYSGKDTSFPQDKGVLSAMMRAANMDMSKFTKAEAKDIPGKTGRSRGGGTFNRLLVDVTNEQQAEQAERDEKHALDVQCEDALDTARQWMQVRIHSCRLAPILRIAYYLLLIDYDFHANQFTACSCIFTYIAHCCYNHHP